MFLEVCREFWGIWKCGKKMPKWPFLPFLSKKCWKGHFCKFCWKDLPNGICKAHRSLDSKMIRVYWKKKKAKRSPERKFDNERGFYSKPERCPDKISSNCLQYEYYLYFSRRWPNGNDWLVYSQNIPNLFLVGGPIKLTGLCMRILKKSKIAVGGPMGMWRLTQEHKCMVTRAHVAKISGWNSIMLV